MIAEKVYHGQYCILPGGTRKKYYYDDGPICQISITSFDRDKAALGTVEVRFRNNECYCWMTKYTEEVYLGQFGIAVSHDGSAVFLQTWDRGLHCLDAKTGERIWWKRYGATNLFVMEDTLVCQRPYKLLQLLDIKTGDLIKERHVSSWGFTSLNHKYIICQTRSNKWEILEAATLEPVQILSSLELTDNHEDFCVNRIVWLEPGQLQVSGFKEMFTPSNVPGKWKVLPNLEFTAVIQCADLTK